jgi:hypothetical protein
VKNSLPPVFFALSLALPSAVFTVMLFVPTRFLHIARKGKKQTRTHNKNPARKTVPKLNNITASYKTATLSRTTAKDCLISQLC